MKLYLALFLCVLTCAARAEFPPDEDVNSAIDARDDDEENPFSGQPEEPPPPKRLNPRTRMKGERRLTREGRELDSDEASSSEESVAIPKRKAAIVRLGFFGGFSKLGSSESAVNDARGQEGLTATYPIGLEADARFGRYFGFDAEGYLSIAPTQNIITGTGSTTTTSQKTIGVMGGGGLAKFVYPIERRNQRWYPSAGVGYGFHQLRYTEAASGTTTTTQVGVNGFLVGGGVTLESGKNWIWQADVQAMLGGKGTLTTSGGTAAASNPGTARYLRAKLGGAYQAFEHFYLGASVLYRSLGLSFDTAAGAATTGSTRPTGAPESQISFVVTAQYAI